MKDYIAFRKKQRPDSASFENLQCDRVVQALEKVMKYVTSHKFTCAGILARIENKYDNKEQYSNNEHPPTKWMEIAF